jgi:hypothetical protein
MRSVGGVIFRAPIAIVPAVVSPDVQIVVLEKRKNIEGQ